MAPRGVQEASCFVCENTSVPAFACAACARNSLADKRRHLKRLNAKRDALRERLDAALQARSTMLYQQQVTQEKVAQLSKLEAQVEGAETEVNTANAGLVLFKSQNIAKADHIKKANMQLASKRQELLVNYFPDLLRVQSLQYSVLAEQLANEQRMKLRKLRATIPLRLVYEDSKRGKGAGLSSLAPPPYVAVCGIRLPLNDDFSGVPPKHVGAALGYLIHYASLASKYLAAPLLHNPGFAASSSTVWQATSFWNQQPSSPSMEFPMYLSDSSGGLPSGEKAAANPLMSVQNPLSGAGSSLGSMLKKQPSSKKAATGGGAAAGSGGGGGGGSVASGESGRQMPRGLRRGLTLLKRSIGALAAGELGPSQSSPPAGWSSIAVFVAVCAALSRDTHLHRGPCITSATAPAHTYAFDTRQLAAGPPPAAGGGGGAPTSSFLVLPPRSPAGAGPGPPPGPGPGPSSPTASWGRRGAPISTSQWGHEGPGSSLVGGTASVAGGMGSMGGMSFRGDGTPVRGSASSASRPGLGAESVTASTVAVHQRYGMPMDELQDEDGESDDEMEGWDIVDLLFDGLPPPPSQTEDVEHWSRAMIVDAQRARHPRQ